MKTLTCGTCNLEKPEIEFSKKPNSRTGRCSKCKQCHNEYVRTVWYKKNQEKQKEASRKWKDKNPAKVLAASLRISIEEAEKFIQKGKSNCDLCGASASLHFDHCHETGKARGVLCLSCNTLMGRMGDNSNDIKLKAERLIKYLDREFI